LEFTTSSRRIELAADNTQRLVKSVAGKRDRLEQYKTDAAGQMSFVNQIRQQRPKTSVAETEQVFESRYSPRGGGATLVSSGTNVPFDLEKLTEQVIRNLDSRLVAHRERTGRVF
jgi:hypothetical protein